MNNDPVIIRGPSQMTPMSTTVPPSPQGQINPMEQRLAAVEACCPSPMRMMDIDKQLAALAQRVEACEADMGKLVRDTIRNVEECATRVADLAKRMDTHAARLDTLRGSDKSAQEEIEALAKSISDCNVARSENFLALEQDYKNLAKRVEDIDHVRMNDRAKLCQRVEACEQRIAGMEVEISKEQLRLFGEDLMTNLDLHDDNASLHDKANKCLRELSERLDKLESIVVGILKATFPPNPFIDEALEVMKKEPPA